MREFFKCLYSQKQAPSVCFPDNLVCRILEEDTLLLEAQPTREEIKQAIWRCESSRVLGPNGYNFYFIKRCWQHIGEGFFKCVNSFFDIGTMPSGANMM